MKFIGYVFIITQFYVIYSEMFSTPCNFSFGVYNGHIRDISQTSPKIQKDKNLRNFHKRQQFFIKDTLS